MHFYNALFKYIIINKNIKHFVCFISNKWFDMRTNHLRIFRLLEARSIVPRLTQYLLESDTHRTNTSFLSSRTRRASIDIVIIIYLPVYEEDQNHRLKNIRTWDSVTENWHEFVYDLYTNSILNNYKLIIRIF